MVSNTISLSSGEPRSLRHICEGCGTPLVLPVSRAGASGPCPKCGLWIDASKFVFPEMPCPASHPILPAPTIAPLPAIAPEKKRMQQLAGGRGRVRADGFLDHEYNERKELFGTLRVLGVFLAVAAVILFVTLYLRDWMMK